eukprot:Rmarinus@m.13019
MSDVGDDKGRVKVAVRVRPLISQEVLDGSQSCLRCYGSSGQIVVGDDRTFAFDHVYDEYSKQNDICEECVEPLLDSCFQGYNATVFAYGQTGSGKTHTMTGNIHNTSNILSPDAGIIPRILVRLFEKIDELASETRRFSIFVSFLEIHEEKVKDLLDTAGGEKVVREDASGSITVSGLKTEPVKNYDDILSVLEEGSMARSTGSTKMNTHSSRSHAVFTITMQQEEMNVDPSESTGDAGAGGPTYKTSKFHLVDLAGSERAKRTQTEGQRLREGIHINRGLLALGNVISALTDDKKRGHVPYRDSKLTRMLQDSLGGNSNTVMIACVSPADTNFDETLNTLKYAFRAKNIKNSPVVNVDPATAEVQRLRQLVASLQSQLTAGTNTDAALLGDVGVVEELRNKCKTLKQSNSELAMELRSALTEAKEMSDRASSLLERAQRAESERDMLALRVERFAQQMKEAGLEVQEQDQQTLEDESILRKQQTRIQALEKLLAQREAQLSVLGAEADENDDNGACDDDDALSSDGESEGEGDGEPKKKPIKSNVPSSPVMVVAIEKVSKEMESAEAEFESRREHLNAEISRITKVLSDHERVIASSETEDKLRRLQTHYRNQINRLEGEITDLTKERERLAIQLKSVSEKKDSVSSIQAKQSSDKIRDLEDRIKKYRVRLEEQQRQLRDSGKASEAVKRSQDEITEMKRQKVELMRRLREESEAYRRNQKEREQEIVRLRRDAHNKEYKLNKLERVRQKQESVLRRKMEEVAAVKSKLRALTSLGRSRALDSKADKAEAAKTEAKPDATLRPTSAGLAMMEDRIRKDLEKEIQRCVVIRKVRADLDRELSKRKEVTREMNKISKKLEEAKAAVSSEEHNCRESSPSRDLPPQLQQAWAESKVPPSPGGRRSSMNPRANVKVYERKLKDLKAERDFVNGKIAMLQKRVLEVDKSATTKDKDKENKDEGISGSAKVWDQIRTLQSAKGVARYFFQTIVKLEEVSVQASDEMERLQYALEDQLQKNSSEVVKAMEEKEAEGKRKLANLTAEYEEKIASLQAKLRGDDDAASDIERRLSQVASEIHRNDEEHRRISLGRETVAANLSRLLDREHATSPSDKRFPSSPLGRALPSSPLRAAEYAARFTEQSIQTNESRIPERRSKKRNRPAGDSDNVHQDDDMILSDSSTPYDDDSDTDWSESLEREGRGGFNRRPSRRKTHGDSGSSLLRRRRASNESQSSMGSGTTSSDVDPRKVRLSSVECTEVMLADMGLQDQSPVRQFQKPEERIMRDIEKAITGARDSLGSSSMDISDSDRSGAARSYENKHQRGSGCLCKGKCVRKCSCRAYGAVCGPQCGCSAAKCSNKAPVDLAMDEEWAPKEISRAEPPTAQHEVGGPDDDDDDEVMCLRVVSTKNMDPPSAPHKKGNAHKSATTAVRPIPAEQQVTVNSTSSDSPLVVTLKNSGPYGGVHVDDKENSSSKLPAWKKGTIAVGLGKSDKGGEARRPLKALQNRLK